MLLLIFLSFFNFVLFFCFFNYCLFRCLSLSIQTEFAIVWSREFLIIQTYSFFVVTVQKKMHCSNFFLEPYQIQWERDYLLKIDFLSSKIGFTLKHPSVSSVYFGLCFFPLSSESTRVIVYCLKCAEKIQIQFFVLLHTLKISSFVEFQLVFKFKTSPPQFGDRCSR